MKSQRANISSPTISAASQSSVLARLRLSAEELQGLSTQGFVAAEYRGERGPFFKLRFRLNGRQQVRYIGKDEHLAAQVSRELLTLQSDRRYDLELARLVREARLVLKQTKQTMAADANGLRMPFHGLQIRERSRT
jgi:hypothetical protein